MSFNPNRARADAQECADRVPPATPCIFHDGPCPPTCPSPATFDPTPIENALGLHLSEDE